MSCVMLKVHLIELYPCTGFSGTLFCHMYILWPGIHFETFDCITRVNTFNPKLRLRTPAASCDLVGCILIQHTN